MTRVIRRYLIVLPRQAVENWVADDAPLLAAAVAYYFAISLFPLLLVLVSAVGYIFQQTQFGQNAEQEIVATAANQVSPAMGAQLETLLSAVRLQAGTNGPLALFLLLVAAIAMFVQFDDAFNRIWRHEPQKSGGIIAAVKNVLMVRLKAFLMLLAVGGVVILAFIVNLVWTGIGEHAAVWTPYWSQLSWWLREGVNLLFNIGAFAMIYRFVPRTYVRWGAALAGAIVAGIGWEIGKQVLSAYVIGSSYGSAYGVIGSFLAVMLWCYYVVAVLFLGAEYARAVGEEGRAGKQ